jgi:hypothetical protein
MSFKNLETMHKLKNHTISMVKDILDQLEPEERVLFFHQIMGDYCKYCGFKDCNGVCENDE